MLSIGRLISLIAHARVPCLETSARTENEAINLHRSISGHYVMASLPVFSTDHPLNMRVPKIASPVFQSSRVQSSVCIYTPVHRASLLHVSLVHLWFCTNNIHSPTTYVPLSGKVHSICKHMYNMLNSNLYTCTCT